MFGSKEKKTALRHMLQRVKRLNSIHHSCYLKSQLYYIHNKHSSQSRLSWRTYKNAHATRGTPTTEVTRYAAQYASKVCLHVLLSALFTAVSCPYLWHTGWQVQNSACRRCWSRHIHTSLGPILRFVRFAALLNSGREQEQRKIITIISWAIKQPSLDHMLGLFLSPNGIICSV